jgi:GGDEF domain-containing protein
MSDPAFASRDPDLGLDRMLADSGRFGAEGRLPLGLISVIRINAAVMSEPPDEPSVELALCNAAGVHGPYRVFDTWWVLTAGVSDEDVERLIKEASTVRWPGQIYCTWRPAADTAALREILRRLENRDWVDQLTGLDNPGAFRAALETAPRAEPQGLVILDVDGLKKLNDRFGHAIGDRLLCHLGDHLRGLAQRSGVRVFRSGGDEFAVITEGWSDGELTVFCGEIQPPSAIIDGEPVPIRFHVGYGVRRPGESTNDLFVRVDENLNDDEAGNR